MFCNTYFTGIINSKSHLILKVNKRGETEIRMRLMAVCKASELRIEKNPTLMLNFNKAEKLFVDIKSFVNTTINSEQ